MVCPEGSAFSGYDAEFHEGCCQDSYQPEMKQDVKADGP
jgi:hypothetical protein